MPDDEGFAMVPRSMLYDPEVPQGAKLVYLALSSHVNSKTGIAFPSHNRVARYLGMSRSTVRVHLVWLRKFGYLTWTPMPPRADGGQSSNAYTLLIRATPGLSQATPLAADRPPPGRPSATKNETQLDERRKPSSSGAYAPDAGARRVAKTDLVPTPTVIALCDLLADLIEENGNAIENEGKNRPNVNHRWYAACRLMIETDGRNPRSIEKVIRWSQADEFWRGNILSMPKLREKFVQLREMANRPPLRKPAQAMNARQRLEESRRRQRMLG